jgi:transcriptional regulator with XRE-family HTH domain
MSSYVRWTDIRAEHVERAGAEQAGEAGKQELLTEVLGHRLAEVRRARGLTQQQVADRMSITKDRVSQIEQGKISGQDVPARFAAALGGRSTSTTVTSPLSHRSAPAKILTWLKSSIQNQERALTDAKPGKPGRWRGDTAATTLDL